MIFLDRTHMICKSVEDFDWFGRHTSPEIMQHNEVVMQYNHPVEAISCYERRMQVSDPDMFPGEIEGRIYCISMGLAVTRGEGGWKNTIINSIN